MFHKSPGGNVEKSKLVNSGQNTTYNEQNYNISMGALGGENDIVSIVQSLASHVACDRKNQLNGAGGSGPLPQAMVTNHTPQPSFPERELVEISSIMIRDPSPLPVSSIADRYTRSMLECLAGYPLYEPEPFSEFSTEYLRNGVNVGDVGFVRKDGAFDFLFNICPENSSINPPNLPNGFSLETPEHSKTRTIGPLSPKTCLFPRTVTKMKSGKLFRRSGKYICKGPEGAILALPEGAIQDEAINRGPFEDLAKRHGVEWYEYTKCRGRSITNGSLYLVTSSTKCTQWGVAVSDRPCDPGQGLRFGRKLCFPFCNSIPKYRWKGTSPFITKVANSRQKDAPNQCVFLQGYKIMIHEDIFHKLCNTQSPESDTAILSLSPQAGSSSLTQWKQEATCITVGGLDGGTDSMSRLSTQTRTKSSTVTQSDPIVLQANFNSSPIHPSDLINAALLSQNPDAKIALTHDDVWCDLLRDNFPLNTARLANITRSYMSTVDEYGCVSLEKFSDSINVESSLGSFTLQEPIQLTTPNEENTSVPIENPMPSVQEKNDSVGHAILYEVHGDTVIFQFGDGQYTEQERGMIRDHLSNVTTFTLRDINDIMNTMKSCPLTPPILSLPNAQAAYGDNPIKNKHGLCVKGTRVSLLQDMADWVSGTDETKMYVLSGASEIGKSTVAYTIAARADALGLLGASFFFSRDSADRDNGKMFFAAIAYRLCLYNKLFAKAIEAALLTKSLSDATMKDPQEQLETLILEPLRNIVRLRIRPILIVVDALDECDDEDWLSVLTGLSRLVQDLPFKVILTTRPQSYFHRFFHTQDERKIFHLQDIRNKIISDDTRFYHEPSLSQELAEEQLQNREESGDASDIEDKDISDNTQPYLQPSLSQELPREQLHDRAEGGHTIDIDDRAINDDTRAEMEAATDTQTESFVQAIQGHIPSSENFNITEPATVAAAFKIQSAHGVNISGNLGAGQSYGAAHGLEEFANYGSSAQNPNRRFERHSFSREKSTNKTHAPEMQKHQRIEQHSADSSSQLTRVLIRSYLFLGFILLMSYIFVPMRPCSSPSCLPPGYEQLDPEWEHRTIIVSCRVVSLRRRWFGLFGKPVPIIDCTPSSCPDQKTATSTGSSPCRCPDCSDPSTTLSQSWTKAETPDDRTDGSGSGHVVEVTSKPLIEHTGTETTSTMAEATSTTAEATSTDAEITSTMVEATSSAAEATSTTTEATDITAEATNTDAEIMDELAPEETADEEFKYWVTHSGSELADEIASKLSTEKKDIDIETAKELLTSLEPPPPPSDTVPGYNPWLDKARPTTIEEYLRNFEVVFVVDDSGSMKGERWTETRDALGTIAGKTFQLKVDTVSLRFLNDATYVRGLQGKKKLISWFKKVKPRGNTPLGKRLNVVFDGHLDRIDSAVRTSSEEYSKILPLDIIVLTDGMPTDKGEDEPTKVVAKAVKRLNDSHYHPNTMGVQIVQIANEDKAKKMLRGLVVGDNGRIVDTVPYAGVVDSKKLLRILLGGVHPNIRSQLPVAMLAYEQQQE